jgi:hypothetical protein
VLLEIDCAPMPAWLGVVNGASRASPVRPDRVSLAKQGERQEYVDVLSLHR